MPHKSIFTHALPPTAAAALLSIALLGATPALALDEQKGEQAAIDACEKKLCTMLLQKNPKGDDLKCQLTKTWAQSTIKEAETGTVSWGYGDARCTVDLNIARAAIISAMSPGKFTYEVPLHTTNCVVEQDGGKEKVTASLAPKIVFRDGKAEKVWINLKHVDGPTSIKSTIWTTAKLEDSIGLFHRQMIKSMNKFIQKGCAKKYPQLASAATGLEVKEVKEAKEVKKAKPEEKPAQAHTK